MSITCKVENCDREAKKKGLCLRHYIRQWRHGNAETTLRNSSGTYSITNGYKARRVGSRENSYLVYEHVEAAEKVLGRDIRHPIKVHHIDGNTLNNANTNLVICPNDAYHQLLHMRDRLYRFIESEGKQFVRGVSKAGSYRWVAILTIEKVRYLIGYYGTREEAIKARLKAAKQYLNFEEITPLVSKRTF